MSFAFREVTISGNKVGVEGTSAALNEITDVMVNEMGWVLEDDRRSQAGSSNVTLTHKVVFNSNSGESGSDANWYFTLTSGTTSTAGTDNIGFQMATSYDTGTHDTSSSGVEVPTGHTSPIGMTLDSNGIFNLWISGNKDGITVIYNRQNTYGFLMVGKVKPFLDKSLEPFGLYFHAITTTTNPLTTSARSIVGQPPVAQESANESEFLSVSMVIGNEPRQGLGNTDAIFTLMPMVLTADGTSPLQKGFIGLIQNAWTVAPSSAGWIKESLVTISGSNQTYLAFPGSTTGGMAIRKT